MLNNNEKITLLGGNILENSDTNTKKLDHSTIQPTTHEPYHSSITIELTSNKVLDLDEIILVKGLLKAQIARINDYVNNLCISINPTQKNAINTMEGILKKIESEMAPK